MKELYSKSTEPEIFKAMKYAERYRSEGFRKKMQLHNQSGGPSHEFAPDAITKLHTPLSKEHI